MNEVWAAALLALSGPATPSMAPWPNSPRVPREALLDRVGGEGRQHVAAARQHPESRAERGAAQHGGGDAAELLAGQPEVRDALDHDVAGRLVLEVLEDLGDAEDADGHRDEVDAGVELEEAEGEARGAGVDVLADHAEQQPEHDHGQRLEDRAVRQRDRGDEAEDDEREVLRRPEAERGAGERRGGEREDEGGDGAGEEGAERGGGERRSGLALLRHLVAVDGGDGGRALAGEVDEDRGGRAAVLGAVVDAGEHDQRRHRLEGEGDGQQHGDRCGRADAGQNADEGAEQHAHEAVDEVDRGERGLEAEGEVGEELHVRTGARGRRRGTESPRP